MELGVSSKPGEAIANFSSNILLGRPAKPEDIVPTALFLASSDSDYATGQIMAIDGGQILVLFLSVSPAPTIDTNPEYGLSASKPKP